MITLEDTKYPDVYRIKKPQEFTAHCSHGNCYCYSDGYDLEGVYQDQYVHMKIHLPKENR